MRVDTNKPIDTDEEGCVAADKVVSQMLAGQKFVGRRVEWPYEDAADQTTDLAGFIEALELVGRIRAGR